MCRFLQFSENLRLIEEHNAAGHSWQLGITKFADLSREEFVAGYASGLARSAYGRFVRKKLLPTKSKLKSNDFMSNIFVFG